MMPLRPSDRFGLLLALLALALAGLLAVHPRLSAEAGARRTAEAARLVAELGLTDLCLLPEARYTRHLSQADLFSAFQDHPGAMDHFPSGSFLAPPAGLWQAAP